MTRILTSTRAIFPKRAIARVIFSRAACRTQFLDQIEPKNRAFMALLIGIRLPRTVANGRVVVEHTKLIEDVATHHH